MLKMLHQLLYETSSQFWDQKPKWRDIGDLGSYERLPYQLWSVSKHGPCADAAVTGIMPPPLMEVQLLLLLGSQVHDIIVQYWRGCCDFSIQTFRR